MRRPALRLAALISVALAVIATQADGRELSGPRVPSPTEFVPVTVPTPFPSPSGTGGLAPAETAKPRPTPRPKPIVRPKPVVKRTAQPRVSTSASSPSVAAAKAYALARIGATQFSCLDKLFRRESNWNPRSYNRSSGAYGIPQALPGSKMGVIASDWRTNPITQVKWGLRYIAGRYGTACKAWAHSQSVGWY